MSSLLDALIAAEEYPPLKGDRGPKGDTGDKGDKGDTGYQGLEGPTGPMGPDGPKGDPGPEGPIGKDGKRGPKGDKGDKGDEGPAGKDGAAMGIAGGRSSYNVRGFASGMVIDDEGTKLNSGAVVGEIDFVGSGVSTAIVGSKAVVTVAGGSGLPSGGTVGQVVTNTGPGAGDWDDVNGLPSQWSEDGHGAVTATTDNGGTPITIVPDSATGTAALEIDAPVDFENHSANMIVGKTSDGTNVLEVKAYGYLNVNAPTGQGYPRLELRSVDHGTFLAEVGRNGVIVGLEKGSGGGYLQLYDVSGVDFIDYLLVGPDGFTRILKPSIRGTTAPADGDIQDSEVHLYFDSTNGATALKLKGKSANSTVVTATLPQVTGVATQFLNGTGAFSTPASGSPSFLSVAKWS